MYFSVVLSHFGFSFVPTRSSEFQCKLQCKIKSRKLNFRKSFEICSTRYLYNIILIVIPSTGDGDLRKLLPQEDRRPSEKNKLKLKLNSGQTITRFVGLFCDCYHRCDGVIYNDNI